MREGSRSSVDVGAVTYGRTPGEVGWLVAGWGGVGWLTVFLVGVGLALAGWVTFGSLQADAQTVEPLDPADCADPSGMHLPDGYASLDPSLQPAVVADCEALVAIRNHFLFGADGTETLNRTSNLVNWGTGASTRIDSWGPFTFDSTTGRVMQFRLVGPTSQLTGTIPPAISDLTALRNLRLFSNRLTGPIPDLSALTNLDLLWLGGNMLSGSIPDLSTLTNLRILKLNQNMLSGPIPDLSALTNLEELWLFDNMLSGPIPDLSALTNLWDLQLQNNMLTRIPDLSGLSSLTRLVLNDNMLSGPIPDLSALTGLTELSLQANMLSGPIPDLSAFASTLTSLGLFDNELSGPIPASVSTLTGIPSLHLGNNMLSGPIPDLSALTNLTSLILGNNMLSGPIPDLSALTNLRVLILRINMLSGPIPDLSTLTMLTQLDLGENMLTGPIPDLSALTELTALYVYDNNLDGPPPDLSGLPLRTLWLCGNPRLIIDSATLQALENDLGIVSRSTIDGNPDHSLCSGPAPVVEVLRPGDGEVVFSWTFDGLPTVSHFEYRSRPRDNELGSYDAFSWEVVEGGASANTLTVTMVNDDPIEPFSRIGDNLVTGERYEFWLRAVYDDGDPLTNHGLGTSHWQVFEAVAGVNPVGLPPIAVDGVGDDFAQFSACAGGDGSGGSGFEDVAGSFAVADIECIFGFGITQGRTATLFAPGEVVSRWQMALFLARAARVAGVELADPVLDQGFTDIGGLSEEAAQAANALAAAGIMPGTSLTEFSPNSLVTRVSMATLLDSFLDEATIGVGGTDPADVSFGDQVFTDIEDVSVAGYDAIRNIYELGVTRGVTATLFGPDQMVTREQMAAFIARMLSHTVARPAGITIQMEVDDSPSVSGNVAMLVSVRDSDFQPVVDTALDLFSYTDAGEAFGAAGECTDEVTRLGAGIAICEIDLGDNRTDTLGSFQIILQADMVSDDMTVVAWTGDEGDTYDDTSTISAALSLAGRQPARQFLVSDNLRETQTTLPFGGTFELVFQLSDMDNNPIALPGVPIRVSTELSAGGTTTRDTRNYRTDSAGRISFPFTQNDPSNGPDPDTTLRLEVATSDEYPINDENTANGCPAGVCAVAWSDDSPIPTTLQFTQASQYTIAGQGATNQVIATLTDQYGQPIHGEELTLQIDGHPSQDGLSRRTNRRGQYVFAYTRNATTSLIDTIIVQHTGGRGPLLPSETDDNTEPPGMKMLTHYWVTEPTTTELEDGIENKTVLIADTANNRIIFQNAPDPEDGTDSNVRYIQYDQNDQYNQNGAISLTTFEQRIATDDATITIETYHTDTNLVSRYTIP